MTIGHFILDAVSDRPYTTGRCNARERVILRSRAYRRLMLCNKIKPERIKEFRQTQILLKKRSVLPMRCQTTAWARIDAEQKQISECADSIDWWNRPLHVECYEFDKVIRAI